MLEGRPLRSILISRLRYLGDVVMATPLLDILKLGDPEIKLGFLAEESHGQVLQGHESVDELHLLRTRRRGQDAQARTSSANYQSLSALAMVRHLRSCHYDLAVDLFFNPRSSWLLRLAGIPLRISGTQGSRRFLFSHNIVPSQNPDHFKKLFARASGGVGEHLARLAPLVHEETGLGFVDWFHLHFKDSYPKPHLPSAYWAVEDLSDLGKNQKFIDKNSIVLAPGATWPVKQWPEANWKALIADLIKQTEHPILLLQPPGNDETWLSLGGEIPESRGGVLPVMKLERVLGLLSRASLFISVDGGIMHAAVGLGVPTIGLFGPTDPELWFPYRNAGPFRVLTSKSFCAPCNLHQCDAFICMPDLQPKQVSATAFQLLEEFGGMA